MCGLHVDDDPGPGYYGRGRGGYHRGYGRGGGRGGPRSVSVNNHASSGANPYNLRITRMSYYTCFIFNNQSLLSYYLEIAGNNTVLKVNNMT